MNTILETYLEGDAWGKMFTFPKAEIRLRREYFTKSEHDENMFLASKHTAKFGSSYFDNVIPGYRDSEGQDCYQCCAFRLDEDVGSEEFLQKIMFEDGAHFSMAGLGYAYFCRGHGGYPVFHGASFSYTVDKCHFIRCVSPDRGGHPAAYFYRLP